MDYFICSICQNTCLLTNININNKAKLDDSNTVINNENNYKKYCNNCKTYNYINYDTVLFKENKILISKQIPNIVNNERLLTTILHCHKCNKKTQIKMFTLSKNDIKQKYICTICHTIFK